MSEKAFTKKAVLIGVILGLAVVGAWLYSPGLIEKYRGAENPAPPIKVAEDAVSFEQAPGAEEVKATQEIVEQEPATEEESLLSGLEEARASHMKLPEPQGPNLAYHDSVEPFFSKEELRFRELLSSRVTTEQLESYPFADCILEVSGKKGLPPALVIGLASYLSNFQEDSHMEAKQGILHVDPTHSKIRSNDPGRENPVENACENIRRGSALLAHYLEKSGNRIVPALVAYRDQQEVFRPELIDNSDIYYISKVAKHVEEVIKGPYQKKAMTPWFGFDSRVTAERNQARWEEASGQDLWLGFDEGHYILCIANDWDGNKAEKLRQTTGLKSNCL